MPRPNTARFPGLEDYVNAQGMSYTFADFFDYKERSDGCYVVLAYRLDAESVGFCDVAAPTPQGPWEFQNDSEECTPAEWKKLKVDPHCDGFRIPGRDD